MCSPLRIDLFDILPPENTATIATNLASEIARTVFRFEVLALIAALLLVLVATGFFGKTYSDIARFVLAISAALFLIYIFTATNNDCAATLIRAEKLTEEKLQTYPRFPLRLLPNGVFEAKNEISCFEFGEKDLEQLNSTNSPLADFFESANCQDGLIIENGGKRLKVTSNETLYGYVFRCENQKILVTVLKNVNDIEPELMGLNSFHKYISKINFTRHC